MKRFYISVGVLILGALALAVFWPSSGDTLYGCTSTLVADRSTYRVGDSVTLTFTLTPQHGKVVRFYTEMHKNIAVMPLDQNKFSPRSGAIDKVSLASDHPLVVSISGKVLAGPDDKTVLVDFGGFGRKVVSRGSALELWARAYPAVIPTANSVEWPWSNHVSILLAGGMVSNQRAGVDAESPLLLAFERPRPGTTHRER
jgi:hypothetical protein